MTSRCSCVSATVPVSVRLATIRSTSRTSWSTFFQVGKAGDKVIANHESRLPFDAVSRNEINESIDGVGWPSPHDLPIVNKQTVVSVDGQAQHCKPMMRWQNRRPGLCAQGHLRE